ncbi:MAG: MFS transporter [Anaerolineaceae bacterium]|nr:MFS transporter [Anaerolineaceae bacterium]
MNLESDKYAKNRWYAVIVFFFFMLLHQADKLMIGPLTTPIQETFGITNTQMGAVVTGALIVGVIAYPLWGWLCDRYSRAKLLALASFLWGASTWLSAIAPTYPTFVATRASTGIDDSSYPGLYSLVADLFEPKKRGRIYGLLQIAQPLGYLIGMVMALMLAGVIGWRAIFYITGTMGIIISVFIFLGVREPARGASEPELADLEKLGVYKFDWKIARDLFKKKSMIIIFTQGFFGVFPWNVITYWFFAYLERERGYDSDSILFTMAPAILVMAVGYFIGGALGDYFFKRTPKGRLIVSIIGVLTGAFFLYMTLAVPIEDQTMFSVYLVLTALFMPFAAPNVIATVYDISLPEVRSSALAVEYFIESAGAALAPLIAGYISDILTLKDAILIICISTWLLCGFFFTFAMKLVPPDIKLLRSQLRERAEIERARQAAEG